MNHKVATLFSFCLLFCLSFTSFAQCPTWNDLSNKDELEGDHSVYRQAIKAKDYETAFNYWEKVFSAAPAADGMRDFHFTDGIKLYKEKLKSATDDESSEMYKAKIAELYDSAISCYENKGIKLSKCTGDDCYTKKMGYLTGRKAYDMFYTLNSKYSKNVAAFQKAIELGGNDSEYILLMPYATIAVHQFQNEYLSKEETRAIHSSLNDIADHNIANNQKYGIQYEQAKEAMNAVFSRVERQIFDCDYFKNKLRPEYDADADNPVVIKKVLGILKGQGCAAGDPMFDELDRKWKVHASAENARIQAEFEASNPGMMANKLYKEGNFDAAVAKYNEAIRDETDLHKKAGYHFSKASILGRKLKKYNAARSEAKTAASLRPNWGRPFMLIGDLYASSARNCGDSWNQRLAILAAIDKYNYAKSIDPEVSGEAIDKVSKYRNSRPDKETGFMQGVKSGDRTTVGCWIGETVTVKY